MQIQKIIVTLLPEKIKKWIMDANVSALTPAQVKVLDMMSFVKTPAALAELGDVISSYFAKRLDEELDKLWEEGVLNDARIEEFRTLHERTPYK